MSLNADVLLDRISLKAKLKKWQLVSLALLLLLMAVAIGKSGGLKVSGDHIARITINGTIFQDDFRDAQLVAIRDDKHVKALIVRIDSPGGTTVGGESIYYALREIAKTRPVVAVMGTLAASGGYMTALGADYIVARKGTITGSIGVLVQNMEATELAGKMGLKFQTFKSAPLKGAPSPFEKVTPEVEQSIQAIIKDFYDYFVGMVAERRNMPKPKAYQLADGRIYTGNQAVQNGLIDKIGGEKEAVEWLVNVKKLDKKLEVRDVELEDKEEKISKFFGKTFANILGGGKMTETVRLNGLMTIWQPGVSN